MLKKIIFILFAVFCTNINSVYAKPSDFYPYFKVNMDTSVPNLQEYWQKLRDTSSYYDKGYLSRFDMGKTFKKEFSKTIKMYGLSENRIKSYYEDDLLEVLSWLPKESYQYIGPMLHEVPGMSEKILNMPGIKETKNKFPKRVAERFEAIENIEFLSPGLYFLLMPEIWEETPPKDTNEERPIRVKKPQINVELPDFLKKKIGLPVKTAEKKKASAKKEMSVAQKLNLRTLHPTLTSPLTSADVKAFVSSIDSVMQWGNENTYQNYGKLIQGEIILDMWEAENGTALPQNDLKDVVNPCQRLVLKTKFAGVYDDFSKVVVDHGFSPEGWAYTCDRTIKAFRVAEANSGKAYAVRFHRRGYYKSYIDRLPKKWRDQMYATEAAIIRMYAVTQEDVEIVKPYKDMLRKKFGKMDRVMLTAPIIY